jgi:hypothetical protein
MTSAAPARGGPVSRRFLQIVSTVSSVSLYHFQAYALSASPQRRRQVAGVVRSCGRAPLRRLAAPHQPDTRRYSSARRHAPAIARQRASGGYSVPARPGHHDKRSLYSNLIPHRRLQMSTSIIS